MTYGLDTCTRIVDHPRYGGHHHPRAPFYLEAWNSWDDSVVDEILSPDFVFRGSLGDEVHGPDGWRSYRHKIRAAVPDFTNEIVDLVVSGERAAVRLSYSGHHQGTFLGIAGTGQRIGYGGAAFFTAATGRLTQGWVLGDLDSLRRQLGEPAPRR